MSFPKLGKMRFFAKTFSQQYFSQKYGGLGKVMVNTFFEKMLVGKLH